MDDFNTEDKTVILEELYKRLAGCNRIELEIGSGNGKFITELALNDRDRHFIGIEYSYKALKKSVSKAYKRKLKNITLIFGEANNIIDKYIIGRYEFDNIYLNFPDPWPKKKHSRRRIFNVEFLEKIYAILKEDGVFYSVTDDDNYALEIMNPIYKKAALFKNILLDEYSNRLDGYGVTLYEEKMRALGRDIYFFAHKK